MKLYTKIERQLWSVNTIWNIGLILEGKRETRGRVEKWQMWERLVKESVTLNEYVQLCMSDGFGKAVFSCTAVEINDQQHSAFCFTYSSWKVYKTLKLSSFVSLHVSLNAFHFSLSKCFYLYAKVIVLWTTSVKVFLNFFPQLCPLKWRVTRRFRSYSWLSVEGTVNWTPYSISAISLLCCIMRF